MSQSSEQGRSASQTSRQGAPADPPRLRRCSWALLALAALASLFALGSLLLSLPLVNVRTRYFRASLLHPSAGPMPSGYQRVRCYVDNRYGTGHILVLGRSYWAILVPGPAR